MDGLLHRQPVIVPGRHQRSPKRLDAGCCGRRFDRPGLVDRPDLSGRKMILRYLCKKVAGRASISNRIAQAPVALRAADLANPG